MTRARCVFSREVSATRGCDLRARFAQMYSCPAAIGIAQRKSLGRLRHLDTQALWIQDADRSRRVRVEKVPGSENVSDMGTKHLIGQTVDRLLQAIGVEFRNGRVASALALISQRGQPALQTDERRR